MLLDQTRFKAFWLNPEKYRLTYEANIVPRGMAYGLARGLAFHLIAEGRDKGASDAEINAILTAAQLGDKPIKAAWSMYLEYERQYPPGSFEIVATEAEFRAPIPGSPHVMVGKIDKIIRKDGELWCSELKTANQRARYDQTVEDWRHDVQADFEIIGARSLGFEVNGVLVWKVLETSPRATVWEPIPARRSDHQLRLTQLNVHQTCEAIIMLRNTFGIDMPWPHLNSNYPCNKSGTCEYEPICGQQLSTLAPGVLEDYKGREEHLEIVKEEVVVI